MWKEEISEDSNLWSCLGLWFPQLAFLKNASIFVFLSVTALFPTKAGYSVWSWPTGAGNGLLFWKNARSTSPQQRTHATEEWLSGNGLQTLPRLSPLVEEVRTASATDPSLTGRTGFWRTLLSISRLHHLHRPPPHLTRLPSRLPELGLPKGASAALLHRQWHQRVHSQFPSHLTRSSPLPNVQTLNFCWIFITISHLVSLLSVHHLHSSPHF